MNAQVRCCFMSGDLGGYAHEGTPQSGCVCRPREAVSVARSRPDAPGTSKQGRLASVPPMNARPPFMGTQGLDRSLCPGKEEQRAATLVPSRRCAHSSRMTTRTTAVTAPSERPAQARGPRTVAPALLPLSNFVAWSDDVQAALSAAGNRWLVRHLGRRPCYPRQGSDFPPCKCPRASATGLR